MEYVDIKQDFLLPYMAIGFLIAVTIIYSLRGTGVLDAMEYLIWKSEGLEIPRWLLIVIITTNIMMLWPIYAILWRKN
jgi:hypothetical protein